MRLRRVSNCPNFPICTSDLDGRPSILHEVQLSRVLRAISAQTLLPLPQPDPGEHFLYCAYCGAIWIGRPGLGQWARILGFLDSGYGRGWVPYPPPAYPYRR